jgi:hypothetical protein
LALARFFSMGRRGLKEQGRAAAAASTGTAANTSESRASSQGAGDTAENGEGDAYREQWTALSAKHPEIFTVAGEEIDAWHRQEVWRHESQKDWSNAVAHLSALLETHPDSGDFLRRRAAAYVAMTTNSPAAASANLLERALADYHRTLMWVDRFPGVAKAGRLPFLEKRREVYLQLGRRAEAEVDEQELKAFTP